MPGFFAHVTASPEQHAIIAGLRRDFRSLHANLTAAVDASPYRQQAERALCEAMLWTERAITHHEEDTP